MNAFFSHRNGASLTNNIDVTAHSVFLFQENEQPRNITGISIPQTSISIAEPIGVQIDELGNDIIHMYQFIGTINDEKVGGLESLFSYVNEKLLLAKMTQP